jgi:hypothetical protein
MLAAGCWPLLGGEQPLRGSSQILHQCVPWEALAASCACSNVGIQLA